MTLLLGVINPSAVTSTKTILAGKIVNRELKIYCNV
jgi:hypothetical protein